MQKRVYSDTCAKKRGLEVYGVGKGFKVHLKIVGTGILRNGVHR